MARSFNGTSDRIALANESNFDFERTQAWTFAAWVNPSSAGTFGAVFSKEDEDGGGSVGEARGLNVFQRGGTTGPQWAVEISNASSTKRIAVRMSSDGVAVGTVRHLAVTYSGSGVASGVAIYENAVSQTLSTLSDTLGANTVLNNVVARFGCREASGTPSFFWAGSIGVAAVWNVVLTAGEIQALARGVSPLRVRPSSLVAFLPLFGTASPEPDYTAGQNVGTVAGTTVVSGPPTEPLFGFDHSVAA